MDSQIIEFLIASVLLTLSPGPDIIYVLVIGIRKGFKDAFLLSFGLVSGILVHTTLVAFGISTLIKTSECLYLSIKIFGALYLLYLAYKVYKSPAEIEINLSDSKSSKQTFFIQGFWMNVLNPKVTLFFMAFLPVFLWNKGDNQVFQFYSLGLLFMIQALVIFSVVALLAGKFYKFLNQYPKSALILKYLQVFVFIFIALYIILSHEY
jgi:threonine/homoserine/homoserine lactone efflux protein